MIERYLDHNVSIEAPIVQIEFEAQLRSARGGVGCVQAKT
jgi:hypothetical protein